MPNYIKIGKTENLEQRMKDLDNTSVPIPFECIHAALVEKRKHWEKVLHEVFSEYRVNQRRELFTSDVVVKAIRILKAAQIENVTANALIVADPVEESSVLEGQERIARRMKFNFAMVDIPDGAELIFLQDDEVVCTVTQQNPAKVNFREEVLSLSKAAAKALGRDSSVGVDGSTQHTGNTTTSYFRTDATGWNLRKEKIPVRNSNFTAFVRSGGANLSISLLDLESW